MAFSNWVTRDEWNACFFIGKLHPEGADSLGTLLDAGVKHLAAAGYKFTGIAVDEMGRWEKVTQCCDGNEGVLLEMLDGTFDPPGRAKEFLAWAEHQPTIAGAMAEDIATIKTLLAAAENGG